MLRTLRLFAISILVQIIAASTVTFSRDLISPLPDPLILSIIILTHSAIAWGVSLFLALPHEWRIFNLVFVSALYFLLNLPSIGGLFGAFAILLLILFLPTIWSRVPYYPTNQEMYEVIANQLPREKTFRYIDLGCGFSGLLIYLSRKFPNSNFVGVELSPLAYFISTVRVWLSRKRNIQIKFKSIWLVDLSQFDFTYAFLAPPPMPRIWEKASREMKPGSQLFINSFPCPAQETKMIKLSGERNSALYLYEIKSAECQVSARRTP